MLRSDQAAIVRHPAKTKVLAMGRRWGKSVLGGVVTLNVLRQHGRVAWIVPTYKNGRALWRWVRTTVAPLAGSLFDVSKQDRTITTSRDGFFGLFSADNIDGIRGEWFHLVVIDEAARVAATDWTDAIQPTLADADGDAILISTPMGRNWFYEEWQRGAADGTMIGAWQAPTSANPNPRIQRAAMLAKERVPAVTYQQEWLAQFVDDGAALFRLSDLARARDGACGQAAPLPDHTYLTSVDVGRRQDATVINTFDVTDPDAPYQRVAFDRLERVPYPAIQQAIAQRARQYPGRVIVESNGVGDPVIENLDVAVAPFVTTAKTKVQAIQALQLLLEQGRLKADWTAQEYRELAAYQWDDRHLTQDCVMSLAIGAYHLDRIGPWVW